MDLAGYFDSDSLAAEATCDREFATPFVGLYKREGTDPKCYFRQAKTTRSLAGFACWEWNEIEKKDQKWWRKLRRDGSTKLSGGS